MSDGDELQRSDAATGNVRRPMFKAYSLQRQCKYNICTAYDIYWKVKTPEIKRLQKNETTHRRLTYISNKGSPYSITDSRVPELIPVLGSRPAGDVSHKPGGRLSLLW